MLVLLSSMILAFTPAVSDTCKQGRDSLTGRIVHLDADVVPECEGGEAAFLRRLNKSLKVPDSLLADNIQSTYMVGYIVEADGRITGGRVIGKNANHVGEQLLKAI